MATNIQKRVALIKKTLDPQNLARVGYPVFVKNTPIKTGNAVKHTFLNGVTILGNYPYALVLNKGRSKQSPDGMGKPTIAAIRAYIKKTLGI